MNQTVRRTPINNNIPNNPDFKVENIVDFRGINSTDNPLTTTLNTASDLLNLYVDESNVLTTRPRTKKEMDLRSVGALNAGETFISAVRLNNRWLIQYSTSARVELRFLSDTNVVTNITGYSSSVVVGTRPIECIENQGIVYILDGVTYKYISGTVLRLVLNNAYVPTTKIGGSLNDVTLGTEYESYNVFSTSYKENYIYPTDIGAANLDNIVGKTVKITGPYGDSKTLSNATSNQIIYTVLKKNQISTYQTHASAMSGDGTKIVLGTSDGISFSNDGGLTFKTISLDVGCYGVGISRDGNTIFGGGQIGSNWSLKDCILSTDGGNTWTTFSMNTKVSNPGGYGASVAMSNDGTKIFYNAETYIYSSRDRGSTWTLYNTNGTYTSTDESPISCSTDGTKAVAYYSSGYSSGVASVYYTANSGTTWTPITLPSPMNTNNITGGGMVEDGSVFYVTSLYGGSTTRAYNTSTQTWSTPSNAYDWAACQNIQFRGTKTFGLISNTYGGIYRISDNQLGSPTQFSISSTNATAGHGFGVSSNGMQIMFTVGNVIYTNTMGATGSTFIDVTNTGRTSPYYARLTKSLFYKFFQNKCWLGGCENLVAYSEVDDVSKQNNLTYFPEINTNLLGDNSDAVTGFNLAGDDVLVTYKSKTLYIINPVALGNYNTYSYTESKSPQGNLAIGNTIISALNEIPLQITKTGIYGLTLIKNVQSSERITTLLSEPISTKWLQEDVNDLSSVITYNYNYWTSFIIHKNGSSKIYLLDNRTMSWFYWELSFNVTNVYVKDNVAYMFSLDGILYSLDTSDIVNINTGTTEYYDDNKAVIPWYWKSQISPLRNINNYKQLVSTEFNFVDTDSSDEYVLDYIFKVYRKAMSSSSELTVNGVLNYIRTVVERTYISRFNYLQMEIKNSDLSETYSKLRLISLSFKYKILGGVR